MHNMHIAILQYCTGLGLVSLRLHFASFTSLHWPPWVDWPPSSAALLPAGGLLAHPAYCYLFIQFTYEHTQKIGLNKKS